MAKKRRSKRKQGAKPAAIATPAKLPEAIVHVKAEPVREPAFWFGFEVTWAKLVVARVAVFLLLALDALMQLPHAPRYGAGDFNVAQLPMFEAIAPGRVAYGVGQLLLAYGFVLVAFGVATRVIVPVCAAIYAWLYFGSQLDSYQHHYLVVVMLAIASFVPWERPAEASADVRVRAWAVRLLLVQLAIMYLWAAASKMDSAWVEGTTLSMQLTGGIGSAIRTTIGFAVASVLVIVVELVLAATVWARPAWKIAAPLGLVFHLGIVFTGLEIGLFAFLMLGIYVLVIPDSVWIAIAARPADRMRAWLARPSTLAWAAGTLAAAGLALLVELEDAFVVALALSAVPLVIAVHAMLRRRRAAALAVGVAHVFAIGLWLAVDRTTSITEDYYRYWGGSQRRIGTPAEAERAYRRLTEVAPESEVGHYHLGRLLLARGAADEGLRHLREAQRLEPAYARAFVEEARWLHAQGRTAEAIEKAKQATFADPSHAEARALLDSLVTNKPLTPSAGNDP